MKWEVNSGVGMPGNGGYKKSKSKGEVSISSESLIKKTIDLMISYVQCPHLEIIMNYLIHKRFIMAVPEVEPAEVRVPPMLLYPMKRCST